MKPLHIFYNFKGNPNAKSTALFCGSNGYSVLSYSPLIKRLKHNFTNIVALELRGSHHHTLGAPPEPKGLLKKGLSFPECAEDIIEFLDEKPYLDVIQPILEQKEKENRENNNKNNNSSSASTSSSPSLPLVAITHSMSAAALLGWGYKSNKFSGIIGCEPAHISPYYYSLVQFLRATQMLHHFEPVKFSSKKKDIFESVEEYREAVSKNPAHRRIHPETIEAIVQAMAREVQHEQEEEENNNNNPSTSKGKKVTLTYSKAWETHHFLNPDYIYRQSDYPSCTIPILAMCGKPSLFVTQEVHELLKQNPHTTFLQNSKFGHLLPLEGDLEWQTQNIECWLKEKNFV